MIVGHEADNKVQPQVARKSWEETLGAQGGGRRTESSERSIIEIEAQPDDEEGALSSCRKDLGPRSLPTGSERGDVGRTEDAGQGLGKLSSQVFEGISRRDSRSWGQRTLRGRRKPSETKETRK